jgi:predicted methyltransferase
MSLAEFDRSAYIPEDEDEQDDGRTCETCAGLRTELAKAKSLLKTIRRLEARPAKRENVDDDPATLEAVGHAVFVAQIRARIDLFLNAAPNIVRG